LTWHPRDLECPPFDLAAVERFEAALAKMDPTADASSVVAVGYYLHNLYSALENS
jgi:hypothetical protein